MAITAKAEGAEVISVRRAAEADVLAISAVTIASITQLCAADHHDDPAEIAHWTRNKSPDGIRAMLANPDLRLFVAERDGVVAGVGGVQGNVIGLNYVAPAHRLQGVSKALMLALEAQIRSAGYSEARLMSSATAYRFYLATGWIDVGEADVDYSTSGRPMRKVL